MRILIIGAGNTGRNLAAKFCEERHDVVLIDKNPDRLSEMEAQLDLLTVGGSGSNPRILAEAGIDVTQLLVAVTDSDEVNILACLIARDAGVPHRVARVSNADYLHTPGVDLRRYGVDLAVNQKEQCAEELFNILRMPGALEAVDLLDGRIQAVGMKVHMDSPLLRAPLKDFAGEDWLETIRFIAMLRGEQLITPRGETQVLVGDEVYFVGRPDDIGGFLRLAWPERSRFQKVIIAGGGDVGLHLARRLETTESQVVLMEQDEDRAEYCSGILNKTLILHHDALDQESLEEVGMVEDTAYVAVTGDDENNIISCLLAAKIGARFTFAQIGKPEYVPIINSLSLLDRAVSPHLSMINEIMHFIRGKNVRSVALMHRLPGELIEVQMTDGGKWNGCALKDIRLPEGSTVATVMRGEQIHVATGDIVFESGDRVVIFCLPDAIAKLTALFRK